MTDEELEPFLSGSMGVAALDLARELLGTRLQLSQLTALQERTATAALQYATVAEMAQGENAIARARLEEAGVVLATLNATIRDFLGTKEPDGE